MLEFYFWGLILVLGSMTALWLLSLYLQKTSVVDIFWGAGFVLLAWFFVSIHPVGFTERSILVTVLVSIWGMRLSGYLLWRNWGKEEDFRYKKWRTEAGSSWWLRSYLQVFLLQGLIMWIISAPIYISQLSSAPLHITWIDIFGTLVWGAGIFFETIGDWQLQRFKANPSNRGKILSSGLWRYTRHPNYFGDACVWWGLFIIAAQTQFGILTIISPILMTLLLRKVSGVTLLERTLIDTKPGYQDYIKSTNAFLPWFPRKQKEAPYEK
jgi:steroid 5-alpha reductase family enzyme